MRAHLSLAAALLLTGCITTAPVVAPPSATTPRPQPLEVQWTRTSAEHAAIFAQTYRLAGEHVRAVADTVSTPAWTVILDADETVLDNSLYQRERAALGLGFTSETWDAWVRRQEATALPGAVAFTRLVSSLGGRVVIVTNRSEATCGETRANLSAVGVAPDAVLCQTGPSDKNPRFEAVQTGTAGLPPLRVVMWVGDNIQDFPALSQTTAAAAEAQFGRRFWVLPNPMYGSWTRNPDPAEAP
ncbi:MAG TPA: HAD family acid phosphatase [Rubricoccaceae bacterium]|jgi:5'-nucleotidase (lipoprotein e(P4) family)